MRYTICRKGFEGQIFDSTFGNMITFEIDEKKCIFKTLNYISEEKVVEKTKVEIAGTFDKFKTVAEIEDCFDENFQSDNDNTEGIDIIKAIIEHIAKSQEINQIIVNLDSTEDFKKQVSKFKAIKDKKVSLEIQQSTSLDGTSLDEKNCTFGTDSRGNDFVYYRENNIVIQKNELCTVVQTLGFAGYIQMSKTMKHFEEITENI